MMGYPLMDVSQNLIPRSTRRGVDTSVMAATDCAYKILTYPFPLSFRPRMAGREHTFRPQTRVCFVLSTWEGVYLWSPPAPIFLLKTITRPWRAHVPVSSQNVLTCCSPLSFPWILSTSSCYNKHTFSWRVCKPGGRRKATCVHYSQFTMKLEQLSTTLPRTLTTQRMSLLIPNL